VSPAKEPASLAQAAGADLRRAGEDAAFPSAESTAGVSDQTAASGEDVPRLEHPLLGSNDCEGQVDQHISPPAAVEDLRSGPIQGPSHLKELSAGESFSKYAAHPIPEGPNQGMPAGPEAHSQGSAEACQLEQATPAAEDTPDLALKKAAEERGEAYSAHSAIPVGASIPDEDDTGRESTSEPLGGGGVGGDNHLDRVLPASTGSGGLSAEEGETNRGGTSEPSRHQDIPGELANDWHLDSPVSTGREFPGSAGGHSRWPPSELRLDVPEVTAEDWHHDMDPPAVMGREIPAEMGDTGRGTVLEPEQALCLPGEMLGIAEKAFPGAEGESSGGSTSEPAQAEHSPEVVAGDWGDDLEGYENADWHDLGGLSSDPELAVTHSLLEPLDDGGSIEDGIQQDAQG